jgi:EAL domain-containing protein (putative c-di-GMP-specific phosphodiesterase class I)/GGDEF domain-containing protein
MIRQIGLLLTMVVLLAFGGSAAVGTWIFKQSMESQWQARNGDAATLLAQRLNREGGDLKMIQLVLQAQFDAGHYRRIRLAGLDGSVVINFEGPENVGTAPTWFIRALPLQAPPGEALVIDGWRQIGRLSVESHGAWAYNALWNGMLRFLFTLLVIGAAALVVAFTFVRDWRRSLEGMVAQAKGVEEARFNLIAVPRTLELEALAKGMNSMVRRVKLLFENQASQLDTMRLQLQRDSVSGVSNRAHFLSQLERTLGSSSTASTVSRRGSLILLRVQLLNAINRRVGRNVADKLLADIGGRLTEYAGRVEGSLCGRLNGSDFALYVPVNGVAKVVAEELAAAMRPIFQRADPEAEFHIGALDGLATGAVGKTLSKADQALAQAESAGPFTVEVRPGSEGEVMGEQEWRRRVTEALQLGRTRLMEFPLIRPDGALVHLECPLRLQLEPDGPFYSSAHWLPMAIRAQLVQQADLMATRMALDAIARDGLARSVYMSATALADAQFVQAVSTLLAKQPQAALKLVVEATESAAHPEQAWPAAAALWKPMGVRFGLGGAKESLQTLLEAKGKGLDFLKVDGRFLRGIHQDARLADYAGQLLATARSIGVTLYAEGISQPEDLPALWRLGFDGATGPAIKRPLT